MVTLGQILLRVKRGCETQFFSWKRLCRAKAGNRIGVLVALASPWHKLPGGKLYSKSPQE